VIDIETNFFLKHIWNFETVKLPENVIDDHKCKNVLVTANKFKSIKVSVCHKKLPVKYQSKDPKQIKMKFLLLAVVALCAIVGSESKCDAGAEGGMMNFCMKKPGWIPKSGGLKKDWSKAGMNR
jgi:hypothetical protein